jgi:PAS domain S-box-containing protein
MRHLAAVLILEVHSMDATTKAGSNGTALRAEKPRGELRLGTHPRTPELRYQRLFETSHDGIIILDATNGRIIDTNPFMTHLLGFSHEEFLGKQLWEVGLLRDADRRRGVLHDVADLGVVRWEELLVQSRVHPTGMDVEIVSNRYSEGDRHVIQCHVRDITDRRRADASAALQAEELAVADRHKDEFMAMLSHELRNAIAPVANALVILGLEQNSSSPLPNRARLIIERQLGHLSHLVDDLLDLSNAGRGTMRLQPALIDLRPVVQRSVEAVMSAHAHRNQLVTVTVPATPVWIDADVIRLEQVLMNLLSNAANYTPDSGSITVNVDRAGDRAELRVTDNGIGIAPEMLTSVFDLFTRAKGARGLSRNGLGIGLNIVKRIVELHGGSVVARSDGLGAGSEFLVSLPLTASLP